MDASFTNVAIEPVDGPWQPPPRVPPEYLEALGDRITELCANINAAQYRLLKLIAEFDRLEGWGGWGIKSCVHWLNWRCGIAAGAAREKVRVARALESLPKMSQAFEAGEVSYSKVRAMTRRATPENEEYLLMIARHGTAAHVETLIRKYRQVERIAERAAGERQHRSRALSWYYDEDGTVVIRARLPAAQCALVLKALEAARQSLRADAENVSAETGGGSGAPRDASAETSTGSGTAGVSAETFPAAGGVPEETSGRAGVRDVSAETPPRVAEAPEPYAAQRADALVLMAESYLASGARPLPGAERCEVVVHVSAETLREDGEIDRCELEEGPWLAAETARRIACDASIVPMLDGFDGEPLNVGRRTRSLSPALKRALESRDAGCRFPGCTARRFVDGHHIHHWADGGETRLDNLVLLCRHHHRLVHEGGFGLRRETGGRLVFTRPDGRLIDPVPPPVRPTEDIVLANRELGLAIDAHTGDSLWRGEQCDWSLAVEGLMARTPGWDWPHANRYAGVRRIQ
jgi:hypothetical protein